VLVTKDELLDALWPDVAVTPDTLNKSISELRAAFNDDSHAPRFIGR
jgi:DNA-binding winged helix-turn-helix (wHTH) protein